MMQTRTVRRRKRSGARPSTWWRSPRVIFVAIAALIVMGAEAGRLTPAPDFTLTWLLPIAIVGLALSIPLSLWRDRGSRKWLLCSLCTLLMAIGLTRLLPDYPKASAIPQFPSPIETADVTALYWKIDRDNPDSSPIVTTIRHANADVVIMEELDGAVGATIDPQLNSLYPYRSTCRTLCAHAIFSKMPIVAERRFSKDRAPLIWVRTSDTRGQPLTLVIAHIASGSGGGANADAIAAELASLERERMILVGDFNLPPWSQTLRSLDHKLFPLVRWTHGVPTWPGRIGQLDMTFPFPFLPTDQVYAGPHWSKVRLVTTPSKATGHFPIFITLAK